MSKSMLLCLKPCFLKTTPLLPFSSEMPMYRAFHDGRCCRNYSRTTPLTTHAILSWRPLRAKMDGEEYFQKISPFLGIRFRMPRTTLPGISDTMSEYE